jgi:hypothetical protein
MNEVQTYTAETLKERHAVLSSTYIYRPLYVLVPKSVRNEAKVVRWFIVRRNFCIYLTTTVVLHYQYYSVSVNNIFV